LQNNSDENERRKDVRPDDINSTHSTKSGFSALIENVFRKFQAISFASILAPIAILYVFCIAVSLTPGFMIFQIIQSYSAEMSLLVRCFLLGIACGMGFVCFVFTLIFVVPLVNLPLIPLVRSYRGPWFSIESIPWYYHNALTYLVRYTILDFLTPSPLNILFFKMMGMKIGKGVMINTSNISDPCLIILDDYVTIGGSAYMMAHYGMKGYLIIDKLHIKKGAMIGLAAKILGGVSIGEKAVVAPNVAVLPKTIIKDGEKFGLVATSQASNL
jgi:hypothetical protein